MRIPVPPPCPGDQGVGERAGSEEVGWSRSVFRDDPGLCESQEVDRLEGGIGQNCLHFLDRRLAIPESTGASTHQGLYRLRSLVRGDWRGCGTKWYGGMSRL